MAKFKDLDLRLNTSEKVSFGDSLEANLTYTTLSGYNTPSGIIPITPASPELVVDVPVAGERATAPYHLVRYDQLADAISDVNPLDWQESVINFATAPPTASGVGERWLVSPTGTSGAFVGHEDEIAVWNGSEWVFTTPNEGFTLRVEELNEFYTYDGASWGLFAATVDHSALSGLDGDDHEQYILVDGSRGFTGTVSGVYPVSDDDLATKEYVDTVSGSLQDQLDALDTTLSGNYVTLDTAQTITGDKVFDNTLTTFLGAVFFDGINITMSGTTLTTEANAVFNYDSTSTINNSGTTNYTSTATTNFESGSTTTFEAGSNLTLSGTNVDVENGTTMNFEDGSTITHEDGSSEVYEGGSITTHVSGSVDVYNDGSVLTFSGAEITYTGDTNITVESGTTTNYEEGSVINNDGDTIYGDTSTVTYSGAEITYGGDTNITVQSGTTTTYEDGSTTINEGDTIYGDTSTTVYEDGSEVTFSGTTIFETTPIFNEGLTLASGTTLNLEGVTVSGTFVDENKKWGKITVINNAREQAVVFDNSWPDDDYVVVASLTNEVDAKPSIYSTIQGVKTGAGFTTHFSGKIDSANFVLEWFAFKGQSH